MRKISKIYRDKDKQAFQIHENLLHSDVPFWKKLQGIIGWIRLQISRRWNYYANAITFQTSTNGYTENNISIATNVWHGLKFQIENIRGEIARHEKNPYADRDVNVFVFNAPRKGAYRVSGYFELQFENQDAADYYAMSFIKIKLAKNWQPLNRLLAKTSMLEQTTPINKTWGVCTGSDIVFMNPGEKLSVFINLVGDASPEPKNFTITAHIAINFLEGKHKLITNETENGTWN